MSYHEEADELVDDDVAIPAWAVQWAVLGRNFPETLVEHIGELELDFRLCRWLFWDTHEAFWSGVSVGRLIAETGDETGSDARPTG
jgi:hypothetical protein